MPARRGERHRSLGLPSRAMPRTDELLAHLDGIVHPSRFRRLRPQRAAGPRRDDDAPVRTVATAVSANAETFRRAIAEGRRAARRPPRPALGRPAAALRPDRPARACSSCSTPSSPWPPTTCRSTATRSSATARCWPGRSARARGGRSRSTRASRSASPRSCPRRSRRRSSSRACATPRGREPLAFLAGPPQVRTRRDRDRRRRRPPRRRDAPRASTPSSRASPPSALMARAQEGGCTSSPPGTTRPRPSACGPSATQLAAALRRPPRVRRRAEPDLGTASRKTGTAVHIVRPARYMCRTSLTTQEAAARWPIT